MSIRIYCRLADGTLAKYETDCEDVFEARQLVRAEITRSGELRANNYRMPTILAVISPEPLRVAA